MERYFLTRTLIINGKEVNQGIMSNRRRKGWITHLIGNL